MYSAGTGEIPKINNLLQDSLIKSFIGDQRPKSFKDPIY